MTPGENTRATNYGFWTGSTCDDGASTPLTGGSRMLPEKKMGEVKKANWWDFFLVANCWFKPSPRNGICCQEMRFENLECVKMRLRPLLLEELTALPHRVVFKGRKLIGSNPPPKMLGICCHEMRFQSCKCIKMRLRPGLCPGPRWGSLQRSPRRPN